MNVLATALDRITEPLIRVNMEAMARMFNVEEQLIACPMGEVDLLLGIHLAEIFPVLQATNGNLRLLKSQFGSGFLVDGAHPEVKPTGRGMDKEAYHIVGSRSSLSFSEDEELGVGQPK